MTTLESKLAAMRELFAGKIPAEIKAIMERDLNDLEASGIVGRALKEGGQAPSFNLVDERGGLHTLDSALARGRLVLSFYRGLW